MACHTGGLGAIPRSFLSQIPSFECDVGSCMWREAEILSCELLQSKIVKVQVEWWLGVVVFVRINKIIVGVMLMGFRGIYDPSSRLLLAW